MTEANLICFERCNYFMELQPENGYKNLDEVEYRFLKKLPLVDFSEHQSRMTKIFTDGKIEFINFSCKYLADIDFVLKGIN